jgi:hypothetical protein
VTAYGLSECDANVIARLLPERYFEAAVSASAPPGTGFREVRRKLKDVEDIAARVAAALAELKARRTVSLSSVAKQVFDTMVVHRTGCGDRQCRRPPRSSTKGANREVLEPIQRSGPCSPGKTTFLGSSSDR